MSSLDITITIIITIIIKSGYFSVIGHLSYCPVLHKFLEVIFDDTGKGSLCNSLNSGGVVCLKHVGTFLLAV